MADLKHKERTLEDLYSEFSKEDRDVAAIIVGAVLEDEEIESEDILNAFESMSVDKKNLISFLAALTEDSLEHSSLMVGEFLAHFGVKGMKWGVRKDNSSGHVRLSKSRLNNPVDRQIAKENVRTGVANVTDQHLAQLKTSGRRAINAVTGDKTFWTRVAQGAGVAVAIAGVGGVLPFAMPDGVLTSIGKSYAGDGWVGEALIANAGSARNLGADTVRGLGVVIAQTVGLATVAGSAATNLGRAVRGNARVDKSYDKIGRAFADKYLAGTKKVAKVTKTGPRNQKQKSAKHSVAVGEFLMHHASMPVSQIKN